jgi:hypothetical protein
MHTDSQEAAMCHHLHVMLSAEDKKDVKKLSGIMIPIYASVPLALVALVVVSGASRQGKMVASTSVPAVQR